MKNPELNILIVSDDSMTSAALARALVVELKADISMVDTIEDAVVLTAANNYDTIVASAQLADGSGLSLLSQDERSSMPVIILDDSNNIDRALLAIREGAADVLPAPIEPRAFVAAVSRVSKRHRRHKITQNRTKRLRKLTSKLVRDRRELRQRVDLICRDLVQAYQKLAEKVVEIQETASPDA